MKDKHEYIKWVYLLANAMVAVSKDLMWLHFEFIHYFINCSPLSKAGVERSRMLKFLVKTFIIYVPSTTMERAK